MKPFFVLLIVFGIFAVILKIETGVYELALAGRIAMAIMLLFTAIAHFAFTKGMVMMLPQFIPFKKAVVYITGVFEIAGAIGLLLSGFYQLTGYFLVVFFIAILPANIYAAVNSVDYQKGNNKGSGLNYLWFRIPLQLLFILWIYFSAIMN